MSIKSKSGIAPEIRKVFADLASAMSGNVALEISPDTCGSSAAAVATAIASSAAKYQRTVELTMPYWFNGSLSIAATKSSTSGLVAIDGGGNTVSFVDGKASVTLNYTGTWAEADTTTLTVSGSVMGYTLTQKTSVDTLVE